MTEDEYQEKAKLLINSNLHSTVKEHVLEQLENERPTLEIKVCPQCKKQCHTVKRRKRNTAFNDDENNYIEVCFECWQEDCQYWDERWNDYWSDIRESVSDVLLHHK